MNGLDVGLLTRESAATLRFEYDRTWLDRDAAIPISLSMPLSTAPYTGDVVWHFFDNLLPEGGDVRSRIQRTIGAPSTRPFDLLEHIGRDCVGALQLYRDDVSVPNVRTIDATPLDDAAIAARLQRLRIQPLGHSADSSFRISIAGAQEKTALLWHDDRWHEPRGATPTSHIIKPPIGTTAAGPDLSDSVENEWLCLRLAGAFGLPVAEARVERFDGLRALVVERFDRRWARDGSWLIRQPQEDLCQALGVSPDQKYEADGGPSADSILDQLLGATDPERDRATFVRALVVNWLLAAPDAHAKNFSVFLRAGGAFALTPLYDIVSLHPALSRQEIHARQVRMAMSVIGNNRHYKWDVIRGDHWRETARRAHVPSADIDAILDDCVARGPMAIDSVCNTLPRDFPAAVVDPICDGVRATLDRL